MAWQRLVNQGSAASLSGSAAQHVRDLLALCHIPATIPPSLAAAAADPLLASPHDGPEFMVRVRNKIAHPPHKGRKGPHNLLSSEAVVGAWRLGLEYLQLAILNWLGFHGWTVSAVDLASRAVPWPEEDDCERAAVVDDEMAGAAASQRGSNLPL